MSQKTASIIIKGSGDAKAITRMLVTVSQWFQFEPYPNDDYKITVEAESKRLLDQIPTVQADSDLMNSMAIAYYKACACGARPEFVPAKVQVLKRTFSDFPDGGHVLPGEYACKCNKLGAVRIALGDGKWLGLRLDEFEPIAWRKSEKAEGAASQLPFMEMVGCG